MIINVIQFLGNPSENNTVKVSKFWRERKTFTLTWIKCLQAYMACNNTI